MPEVQCHPRREGGKSRSVLRLQGTARTRDMSASEMHTQVDLARVVEAIRQYLWLPDPGPLYVALATVAANRTGGDPVWTLLVGPPSSGKTEILHSLSGLPDVHRVDTFSEAGLVSGSSVRTGDGEATGGLLVEMGDFGILAFEDFTTVLSEHGSTRNHLLACLRRIYDGEYTRSLGTRGGRTFAWRGKAGFIGAATEAVDVVDLGPMGERFAYYRLPPLDETGEWAVGLAALDNIGHQRELRDQASEVVSEFLRKLPLPKNPLRLTQSEEERLVGIATLGARCRSVVVRDSHSREVDLVPSAERSPRLLAQLGQLLGGLVAIRVPGNEAWRLVFQIALDGMHSGRRRVLDVLVRTDLGCTTSTVAGRARLPDSTARRHLQDLTAHGAVNLVVQAPERWSLSNWARKRFSIIDEDASCAYETQH